MKTLFKILFFFIAISITSCDYLDIVPDERPTENDAFKDVKRQNVICILAIRTFLILVMGHHRA
jgi:hypothetical protein